MTGHVAIDENGDRLFNSHVYIIQNREMILLSEWITSKARMKKLFKPDDPNDWSGLIWPGNYTTIPSDTPTCGWENELCQTKKLIFSTIISCVAIVFVVLAVLAFSLFGKMRLEQVMKNAATVTWCEIEEASPSQSQDTLNAESLREIRGFVETGKLNDVLVAIKRFGPRMVSVSDKNVLLELKIMKNIDHGNVNQFVGVCLDQPNSCYLMTYCSRGSLHDVLENSAINLTWDFKLSLLTDIAQGMKYLHGTEIVSHGSLTSFNCVVNSRWSCQITDYGLHKIKQQSGSSMVMQQDPSKLLWTAPELLRMEKTISSYGQGSQKGDVYSFAIITQEVVLLDTPYCDNFPAIEHAEIISRVKGKVEPPYRPHLDIDMCPLAWREIMAQCWNEQEDKRPSFAIIISLLRDIGGGRIQSLVDSMIDHLETQTKQLEIVVEERSQELKEEKVKMEMILRDLLPWSIAERLTNGHRIAPESFDKVTIFFSDIVSFTKISAAGTPLDVVKMLNTMYTVFDDISGRFDVYKVATIGDAYFVASGVPLRNGNKHVTEICNMSLELIDSIQHCHIPHMPSDTLKVRIGIHTGSCVAGVAGTKMPRYLLFGETVDIASNLEASGLGMRIHISSATKKMLDTVGGFEIEERGKMFIKGLGDTSTYWLRQGS